MKLAFYLFNYFPYGGLQRDFLRIAREAMLRGHEIHVYTMSWEGDSEPGLQVHLVKVSGLTNHGRILSFVNKVKAISVAEQYDLIVGFNKMPGLDLYYAADVCYQSRVKAQRVRFYQLLPRYRHYVALESAVFAAGNKTQVMVISPHQQPQYTDCYGTEPARFHLLPPGIAKDRIAPANAGEIRARIRAELGLSDNDYLLLTVGSGFKTKGVDRAIRAIAALPEDLRLRCRYVVVGQDKAAPYLKLAKQLGVASQVSFLGGRSDVPHYFLAADVLLHPARHENTGTVLLEAMIAGLPVLTLDVCGYAHYVSEENAGVVLPSPFDQGAFNAAVEKMLLSPHRAEWHANGLLFAKNETIYSMPGKAVDLIESLVGTGSV